MECVATSGGDTIKVFNISANSGDPCLLSYTPSPSFHVNSLKWNHTNLVVASAGDDKKITLWHKNGHSFGTIPPSSADSADSIQENISSINFSNKTSRYLCSGGSGQVVRIWDLQRKRCIKWLKGHSGSISDVMYNCKDEHLASISVNGNLIVHNLASGARAAELKDPFKQVLRVLDYSWASRHLLATAGDDGSVHIWDSTGKNPKVSWLKQHSAPTAGLCFSPSNDKIIASVGLDKKLYTFDSGMRRSTHCISYEAPFSSLAYRDDGWILAAGTSNGRVVFYDVRGKPQPFSVLHAYGNLEAVTSLCWQRSKPVVVNENSCTAEVALLGVAVEDSVLMPDPLPSTTLSSFSQSQPTILSGPRRTSSSVQTASLNASSGEILTNLSTSEETPHKNLLGGGVLPRLQATRNYNFKDDMEVFSPLVDVPPITPSLDKLWSEPDGLTKDQPGEMKTSLLYPSRKFSSLEGVSDVQSSFGWKISTAAKQDGIPSSLPGSTPPPSTKSDDSAPITPPEAWGGERLVDKFGFQGQIESLPSRFSMLTSGSQPSGLQDLSSASQSTMNYSTNLSIFSSNIRTKDISYGQETSFVVPSHVPFSSLPMNVGPKSATDPGNPEPNGASSLNLSKRFSTFAERISTSASFTDGTSASFGSPKTKKTGAETQEEHPRDLLSKEDASALSPVANESSTLDQRSSSQADLQQGTSFTLQLFQHTLDETVGSFQKSIHEDMRNLHIEILRQFHMQEMEMSTALSSILDNQAALMREVEALRKENERLHHLL